MKLFFVGIKIKFNVKIFYGFRFPIMLIEGNNSFMIQQIDIYMDVVY